MNSLLLIRRTSSGQRSDQVENQGAGIDSSQKATS